MKVLIINIDSKIQNFALAKIEKYHRDRGDEIYIDFPLIAYKADKIYVSCIFEKNKNCWHIKYFENMPNAFIGGSGYDLKSKLPEEIESLKPRINLGFTTRGCFRKCEFCIVPEKEGKLKIVGDLLDLWDGYSKKITLMDNNILGIREHFELICKQAKDNKMKLDFNQGLDHRLLDDDIAYELKSLKLKKRRFAFDHPSMINSVEKAIDILDKHELFYNFWYVLVGYDTTFEEDLFRLNYLRERKQRAFIQRYSRDNKQLQALADWSSLHGVFAKVEFWDFIKLHKNGIYQQYF